MEISTDYPLLWKSIRNFHIFSWVEIFLRIFWQPFLLGIFPQNFLLCGNLFLIFQEKIIKIFHNFSRVDLFHKIVVANHAMLRKFRTPQNLSEEGFQLFSCLIQRIVYHGHHSEQEQNPSSTENLRKDTIFPILKTPD